MPEIICPNCGERTSATESDPVCGTCREPIPDDFIRFDTGERPNRSLGSVRRIRPSGMRVGPKLTALILGVGIVVVGTFVLGWVKKGGGASRDWTTYYAADGRFRVDFPIGDAPIRSEDVVTFDDFPPAKRYFLHRDRTHEEYGVSHHQLLVEAAPLDTPDLVAALDNTLRQTQDNPEFRSCTVKEWRTLGMCGTIAREIVLDYQSRDGRKGRMWARALVWEGWFYLLFVFHKDDDKPADPERFFTSFAIQ